MSAKGNAGPAIRRRRLALGLKQAELARSCGISPSYLNLIEHGRRRIGGPLLERAARALGVDPGGLEDGAEVEALRALAGSGSLPADEPADAFAARFPGWAAFTLRQAERIAAAEERLRALSDRIAHDPALATSLHEIVSAATAVRASASILAGDKVDPDWQRRFLRNIREDALRLGAAAEDLSGLLRPRGTDAEDGVVVTAREAAERWIAEGGTRPEGPAGEIAEALVALLEDAGDAEDGAADPFEGDGDPVRAVRRVGRQAGAGLILADGTGAPLLRLPPDGFGWPRAGPPCGLLPLFDALGDPGRPVTATLETPDGRLWTAHAAAARRWPFGADGPPVTEVAMALALGGGPSPRRAVGPGCRLCPRTDCPARRRPAISGAG
ncbi:hypothetical protein BCF33_0465 [Hasllibacter halocynthiae]|uniref:HTH cro/C1-type domain-containing protein n=1 Tax=Hasllibacter halocynthiae TaxID=595589 RepID=A0A2T0X7G0_9RHOB|nr:helix-turn-helix domain-containing protein [Hasllibacter halocynthiae]PRY94863.1 hypothetical protein BCF33_0465 [Hasllibacter halocynthiae]